MKKIFILFIISLFLIGCQTRTNDKITFIDDDEIEYTSDFKVADLIIKVNDYDKDTFIYNDDYSILTLPDNTTVKINSEDKAIELNTIQFAFTYKSKKYYKKIEIKDTTPPEINCKDIYEVELGNEYFDLSNLITCTDNYSKENDIDIYFNGDYNLEKVGKYVVEVIAYDQKDNKTTKKVTVDVKDSNVLEDYSNSQSDNTNESTKDTSDKNEKSSNANTENKSKTENKQENKNENSNYIPSSKTFRIEDYGTFDACLNACQGYIDSCMAKGYQGVAKAQPVQENGIYVGYIAIFN